MTVGTPVAVVGRAIDEVDHLIAHLAQHLGGRLDHNHAHLTYGTETLTHGRLQLPAGQAGARRIGRGKRHRQIRPLTWRNARPFPEFGQHKYGLAGEGDVGVDGRVGKRFICVGHTRLATPPHRR